MIDCLIYSSAATALMDENELAALLAQCRRRNADSGVTGFLLYADGCFIQALEGAPGAVDETFARITGDPRHKGILELFRQRRETRQFVDWDMAYHSVDQKSGAALLQRLRAAMADADDVAKVLFDQFAASTAQSLSA